MSSQLCRDCNNYCVYCQICHVDKDYHHFNDSCKDFTPEDGEWETIFERDADGKVIVNDHPRKEWRND